MNDACSFMDAKIHEYIDGYQYLQGLEWEGEYAGRGKLDTFPTGKLTQVELVELFEYVIRHDARVTGKSR